MDGCSFNLSISALACAIAEGKTNDEINLLSAFFEQLGECLETISTCNEICCPDSNSGNNNSNNTDTT